MAGTVAVWKGEWRRCPDGVSALLFVEGDACPGGSISMSHGLGIAPASHVHGAALAALLQRVRKRSESD